MIQSATTSARNPAIELYRVMLMFLIVLHHAAYHGRWNHAQGLDLAYPSLYWLFSALTIWHVDGFLSITGWFGTRFSLVRFAKLWGLIAFYSIASVLYAYLTKGRLSATDLAGGWFGNTYLYFLFLTPILNAAVEKLVSENRKWLWCAWCVFNAAVVLNWLPYNLFSFVKGWGAICGFSIMTFMTMYINVRLLKLTELYRRVSKGCLISVWAIFVLSTSVLLSIRPSLISYNSPVVMAMATSCLLAFQRIGKVSQCMERVVTSVSPLMFGVYIIHNTTSFGSLLYRVPQDWLVNVCNWHPMLIVLISAVFCFAICIMVEAMRRLICYRFSSCILDKINQIDLKLGFKR